MCPTLFLTCTHLLSPASPPMASLLSLTPGSNPTRQRPQLATLFLSPRFLSHAAHPDLGQSRLELASSRGDATLHPCPSFLLPTTLLRNGSPLYGDILLALLALTACVDAGAFLSHLCISARAASLQHATARHHLLHVDISPSSSLFCPEATVEHLWLPAVPHPSITPRMRPHLPISLWTMSTSQGHQNHHPLLPNRLRPSSPTSAVDTAHSAPLPRL